MKYVFKYRLPVKIYNAILLPGSHWYYALDLDN